MSHELMGLNIQGVLLEYLNKFYNECKNETKEDSVLSSLTFLVGTTNPEYKKIASRMDAQLSCIYKYEESWLKQKVSDSLNLPDVKKENFNGLLGEVRVFGDLLEMKSRIHEISNISTPKSGSDFLMILNNIQINIEVNTPQKSGTKVISTEIEKSTTDLKDYAINCEISASAPYGYAGRKQDNIQYEAVSKFSQIKSNKEDKQFLGNEISILWLDLNDPKVFAFSQLDYTAPILSFNGAISSGFLWNAFYSLKNDNIYSNYSTYSKDVIEMEFDGRFNNSNIDFVIIDCFTHKVIFENYNSKKEIPFTVYKSLFSLYKLNNANSYLSFGNKSKLKIIIDIERNISNNLIQLYK